MQASTNGRGPTNYAWVSEGLIEHIAARPEAAALMSPAARKVLLDHIQYFGLLDPLDTLAEVMDDEGQRRRHRLAQAALLRAAADESAQRLPEGSG